MNDRLAGPRARLFFSLTHLAFYLILTLAILACSVIGNFPSNNRPTPTPTKVIFGTELTPGASKGGAIWQGTITSDTSRAYFSNGAQVNFCTTQWTTDLTFVVNSAGNVSGHAEATLAAPRQCTNNNIVGNVTSYTFDISGQKTTSSFNIGFKITSVSPGPPDGEFGGYVLLMQEGPCLATPHDIQVALTDDKTAEANLNYPDAKFDCGGSKDDILKSDNLVKLNYLADCNNRPASLNDPVIDNLCQ